MRNKIDAIVSKLLTLPPASRHITAFSGGVDSSLTLQLVSIAFPETSLAVIGVSAALPAEQLAIARDVARVVDVELLEVATDEGSKVDYVANKGQSCFHCKTSLYSALSSVLHTSTALHTTADPVTLYNGTNKDDRADPTRIGLLAAANFDVVSPLSSLTKPEVRAMSKLLGLPNHDFAASPCLRSRLAFGVEATTEHLAKIERAEAAVKEALLLPVEKNLRVRLLAGGKVAVELDYDGGEGGYSGWVEEQRGILRDEGVEREFLEELAFTSMQVRRFKSGGEATEIHIDELR